MGGVTMSYELKAYFSVQAKVAAAFSFFVSGMIAALLYHAAQSALTDVVSIGIDLTITCLLTFIITAYFCRASLKSTKTVGILPPANGFSRFLARLFRTPLGFGIVCGLVAAIVLFIITTIILSLLNVTALPFYLYVLLKSLFCMLLGSGVTILEMYAGMCKTE